MAMLSRQAPFYPLFFDIDIFGGMSGEPGASRVQDVVWDGSHVFLRAVAQALFQLLPQRGSLEVAVFTSSGYCCKTKRFKASFHMVFPELIVERAVMCWPGRQHAKMGSHLLVRDHVVCHLQDTASAVVKVLQGDLLACCSQTATPTMSNVEDIEADETALNEWTEVFDENLVWFDPRPGAKTGLRLPFTDKVSEAKSGGLEQRPKLPLGRWLLHHHGSSEVDIDDICVEELEDLQSLTDWIRLGDLSRDWQSEVSVANIDPSRLHPQVQVEAELADCGCICPVCRGRC